MGVLAVGLVALLPLVALAVLAFSRPSSALLPLTVPYQQSGILSYSADADPGPAYPGNRAVTGDPIFAHVISVVRFRFAYLFHAAGAHSLAGRASISATVASTSGWRRTLQLGSPTSFRGDRAAVTADLDLSSLLGLLRRVEATTAVNGTYTLTLVPHVTGAGRLDEMRLHTAFSPRIQFSLNRLELQPVTSGSGATSTTPFAPSAAGSLTGRRDQPLSISLKIARLPVAAARWIALGGIALVVCAMLGALAFMRRRTRDDSAAILSRYGRMIVPVAQVWQLPGVAVIDVEDIEALVRIAELYDRSVLHEATAEGESFWVADESGLFRYALWVAEYAEEEPLEYQVGNGYVEEPAAEAEIWASQGEQPVAGSANGQQEWAPEPAAEAEIWASQGEQPVAGSANGQQEWAPEPAPQTLLWESSGAHNGVN